MPKNPFHVSVISRKWYSSFCCYAGQGTYLQKFHALRCVSKKIGFTPPLSFLLFILFWCMFLFLSLRIPIWAGCLITGIDTFTFLFLENAGESIEGLHDVVRTYTRTDFATPLGFLSVGCSIEKNNRTSCDFTSQQDFNFQPSMCRPTNILFTQVIILYFGMN